MSGYLSIKEPSYLLFRKNYRLSNKASHPQLSYSNIGSLRKNKNKNMVNTRRISNQLGFTLLELMITIAVAGLLAALATPSFTGIIERNRITNETDRLFVILKQARNTAIQAGTFGMVCRSADSAFTAAGIPRCRINGLNGDDANTWNLDIVMYVPPNDFIPSAANNRNNSYRINTIYDSNAERETGVRSISDAENENINTTASTDDNVLFFNQDGSFADNSTDFPFRIAICNEDNDAATGRLIEVNAAGLIRTFDTDPNDDERDCTPA